MLVRYLPHDRVMPVPKSAQTAPVSKAETGNYSDLFDPQVGLKYCAGSEDMYHNLAKMFVSLQPQKQKQLEEAFRTKNYLDYTTYVHALKSSALSMGCTKLSALAKVLESKGKEYLNEQSTDEQRQSSLNFIAEHQTQLNSLYQESVDKITAYLKVHA